MRVGILTLFHGNNNWGGDLQGYALKAYIEDNFKNTNVDLIKYRSGVNVIYKSKFEQMEQYGPSEVIKKISERIVKRKTPADGLLKKRNELFEQFQNRFHLSWCTFTRGMEVIFELYFQRFRSSRSELPR